MGTDTDVGKTFATADIAYILRKIGKAKGRFSCFLFFCSYALNIKLEESSLSFFLYNTPVSVDKHGIFIQYFNNLIMRQRWDKVVIASIH